MTDPTDPTDPDLPAAGRPGGSPADHRYVSCTTYRRSGEAVATPVWMADLGEGVVGFTTAGGSGKVRRLHSDRRVELRPCDVRGRVPDGAPRWTGTAEVVDLDLQPAVRAAVQRKYGWQMRLISWTERLRRRRADDTVGVVITLDGAAGR